MKKYILLSLVISSLLFISACSNKDNEYKEDHTIEFSSESAKFKYCSANIDKSTCSFYRPFILLYVKSITSSSPCDNLVLSKTETCKTYIFTTSYKSDLLFNAKYCTAHMDLPKCVYSFDVLKDIKYNNSL